MRDSTEAAIQSGVGFVIVAFVGFFLLLGGGGLAWVEAQPPAHASHEIFFGCVSLVGAVVLLFGLGGQRGSSVVQKIIVNVTPFVQKFGGQRAGDPPAQPPAGGTP